MILPVVGLVTILTVGITDNVIRYQKVGDQSHCIMKRDETRSRNPGATREFEIICKK
jgi:hypothetical protein